ncbi:MAG: hypothetical protein ACOC56_01090 [Atribacterota bacterium]
MRYLAEVRVFEKSLSDIITMDYVSEFYIDKNYNLVISEARKAAKAIGGKIKIVVVDQEEMKIIYSHTRYYKKV